MFVKHNTRKSNVETLGGTKGGERETKGKKIKKYQQEKKR